MDSILTRNQIKTFTKVYEEGGKEYMIIATVRYDDRCGNGHNTFSITAEIWRSKNKGQKLGSDCESCGMLHDDIAKHFPELAPLLKWHLCSSDGPLHYVANTVYHVKERNLDHARSSAIWLEATDEDLTAPGLESRLRARLPQLMQEFRQAVESLGFTY